MLIKGVSVNDLSCQILCHNLYRHVMFVIVSATRRRRDITVVSVGPRAEKFNIVSSNTHTSAIFPFPTRNTLFGQIWSKNQFCQFKLKYGTYTKSNMRNSMEMFTFSVFDWKYPFWATLVQKIKIVSLS